MFVGVLSIVLIYLAILIIVSLPIDELSIGKAALLGDSFGIINSLFSGLAFAGLIVTVLLQREELKESREIFKAQKFEDAFYRLIGFYKENLNEISVHDNQEDKYHSGVGGLSFQLRKLNSLTKSYSKYLESKDTVDVFRYLIHKDIQKVVIPQSRYLGTMESILLLIFNQVENQDELNFYNKVVSSQLTIHEVKYIFYRCLVSKTDSKLVELVNQSKLIENRISETNINVNVIKLYNQIHGANLPYLKNSYESIFTKKEEKKLKKIHLEAMKS